MDNKKYVTVRNRNAGSTGYTLENGFHREFEYNEIKKNIPLEELQQLSWAPGGMDILKNCLVIEDQNALDYLNLEVDPEYFYTEKDIRSILADISDESLDRLEDTLNFGPDGVIELIKKIAVEEEIPDVRKRDMISEKTGFNVNTAININHILADGEDEETKTEVTARKTKPLDVKPNPERKASAPAPKYKVVKKQQKEIENE